MDVTHLCLLSVTAATPAGRWGSLAFIDSSASFHNVFGVLQAFIRCVRC